MVVVRAEGEGCGEVVRRIVVRRSQLGGGRSRAEEEEGRREREWDLRRLLLREWEVGGNFPIGLEQLGRRRVPRPKASRVGRERLERELAVVVLEGEEEVGVVVEDGRSSGSSPSSDGGRDETRRRKCVRNM